MKMEEMILTPEGNAYRAMIIGAIKERECRMGTLHICRSCQRLCKVAYAEGVIFFCADYQAKEAK